jgi:hypothetical protein
MGASYNPLFETGALCSACHEHKLENGIAGQGTYSEWKQTKYAKPGPDYKECQSCHMPSYRAEAQPSIRLPNGGQFTPPSDVTEDERKHGGKEIAVSGTRYRPFVETHRHDFPGSEVASLLSSAISMRVETRPEAAGLRVIVTLENVGAGHAVPSGHGLKRLILKVTGKGKSGDSVDAENLLPAEERQDDLIPSGAIIGRRFFETRTESTGAANWSVPYWRAQFVESDNRLWPGKPQSFSFLLPASDRAEVRLYYRRASPQWLQQLGLSRNDKKAGNAPLDTLIQEWK